MRSILVVAISLVLLASPALLHADEQLATSEQLSSSHHRHLLSARSKAGWLFGTSSNKKKKKAKSSSYVDPAEKAQALKEGRAVDLAALLELKQLIHHNPDSFFSTWEEDGNPCNFAKVACNQKTGRVSEIDLISKENLQLLYPELRNIIMNHSASQGIASVKHQSHKLLAESAEDTATKPSWHEPDLPGSATHWPSGLYPHDDIIIDRLPSGSAFMKLNQTLRALHISNAAITNKTLPNCWGQFEGLRELTLNGLNLEGTLPAAWAGMINMTQLLLGDNPSLSGSLPPEWRAMQQLKMLDLSLNYETGIRSRIAGTLPPSWSDMAKLETLDLWRTSVVGHLPASWVALKHLQVLSLSDTGISGTLPSAWSKLPKLRTVHLANTLIGGSLPSSWGRLSSLVMLDLRGTNVIEPIPTSWHSFCKKNGTRVWDHSLLAYTWPKPLQYGKVAHVLFPWAGPNSTSWEINHNAGSMSNACHNLAMANRVWNLGLAVGLVVALAFIVFRYRSRFLKGLTLHSRFD